MRTALAWWIFLGAISSGPTASGQQDGGLLEEARFLEMAQMVGTSLNEMFENSTNFTTLQQAYSAAVNNTDFEAFNGSAAISSVAEELAVYFQMIQESLKNTTAFTEQLYQANFGLNCCTPQCIAMRGKDFLLDACCKECPPICLSSSTSGGRSFMDPQLDFYRAMVSDQPVQSFGGEFAELDLQVVPGVERRIDVNSTALHYPLDIFDRDPRVLCFAQWSENLTSHYIEQSSILEDSAQYFASDTGILRFWPASDWALLNQCHRCPLQQVDTYDSRLRPWYRNTIPGSKFLVVIMDLSGSMTGFRLILAKILAQQLLLSLSQNDFFIVLNVSSSVEPQPLMECFNNRTRASPENILTMNEIIENLNEVRGRVWNFDRSLELAIGALNDSAECHGIVAVISDRDSIISDLAGSIEKHNAGNRARVFVFLTGFRRNVPFTSESALETAACNSGGKLFEVQTYQDISGDVMEFTNSLRYTVPLNESREQVFWNHYRNVFGGVSLTGSQPLYIRTEDEDFCNTSFVGVSGTDVNLDLVKEIMEQEVPPFGYGFLMDNNGQLIVHPLINLGYIKRLSSDDLIALDVANSEHALNSSEFEELRNSMLDLSPGSTRSQTLASWVPVFGTEQFQLMNVTYHYTRVAGTPFRVSLVVPVESELRTVPPLDLDDLPDKLDDNAVYYIVDNNRTICSTTPADATNATRFLTGLLSALRQDQDLSITGCSQDAAEQLGFDLIVSQSLLSQSLLATEKDNDKATSKIVLQFASGLALCYPKDSGTCPGSFQPYLEEILPQQQQQQDGESTVYYAVPNDLMDSLFAFRVLRQTNTTQSTPPNGIVGTSQTRTALEELLSLTLAQQNVVLESGGEGGGNESVFYLLDGRGRIVAASDMVTGHFMDWNPGVFEELHDLGVYKQVDVLGSEVRPCANIFRETTGCTGAGVSMYRGILLSVKDAIWWTVSGGLWTSMQLVLISLQASVMAEVNRTCPVLLCQDQTTFYQLSEQPVTPVVGSVDGNERFQVLGVPGTNLLLVEVRGNCSQQERETTLVKVACPCDCEVFHMDCTADDVSRRTLDEKCFSSRGNNCCSRSNSLSQHGRHQHILLFSFIAVLLSRTFISGQL